MSNLGELLRTYAPHIYQAHLGWVGGEEGGVRIDTHWLAAKMAEPTDVRKRLMDEYISEACARDPLLPAAMEAARADAFADILSPAEQAAALHEHHWLPGTTSGWFYCECGAEEHAVSGHPVHELEKLCRSPEALAAHKRDFAEYYPEPTAMEIGHTPAEQAAADCTCDPPGTNPIVRAHCEVHAAMESSPHGGIIGGEGDVIKPAGMFHYCPSCKVLHLGTDCPKTGQPIAAQPNGYTQIDTAPEYTEDQHKKGKDISNAIGRLR